MRVSLPGDRGDLYDTGEHLGGAEAAVAVHVKKDDTGLESVGKLNNGLFPGEAQIPLSKLAMKYPLPGRER